MLHRLPLLTLALALALAGCAESSLSPVTEPSAPARKEFLRVPLTTLDGGATDLARAADGQVVVVALWATWCDACQKELPALARLEAKAKARGDFRVLAVAVGDDREAVEAFSRKHGLRFARLVDVDYALANGLGTNRVPTTLIIDRDGRIIHEGGALDRAALEALRNALH
jgi:cytochrome c biogenesis protein CcmG/thiol:disulfide interchange protein DsbE